MQSDPSENEATGSPFDLLETTPQSRHGSSPTLGQIRQVLRADKSNLIAGLILGILSLGGAVALCAMAYGQAFSNQPMAQPLESRRIFAGGMIVLAVICVIGGIQLLIFVRDHWALRVIVGNRGFSWTTPYGKEDDYLWDDLLTIRLVESHRQAAQILAGSKSARRSMQLLEGLVTQQSRVKKERTYELIFQPDRRIRLDRNLMVGHDVLGNLAIVEGERRGITPSRFEEDENGRARESGV